MSLTAGTTWEVRTTGSDLNGGGYNPAAGTVDYSQQNAAQLSLTDLACANSTTLTSATGGFTAAMVGNLIRIASSTNFTASAYEIVGYTNTNTVTLDRNPTTGASATGGSGKVGGANASLGGVAAGVTLPTSWKIWQKAGAYTVASSSNNASGGRFTATVGGNQTSIAGVFGYDVTRGDRTGTRPVNNITTSFSGLSLIASSGDWVQLYNLELTTSAAIAGEWLGLNNGNYCATIFCVATASSSWNYGFQVNGTQSWVAFCSAKTGYKSLIVTNGATAIYCVGEQLGNVGAGATPFAGISTSTNSRAINCISIGSSEVYAGGIFVGCTIYRGGIDLHGGNPGMNTLVVNTLVHTTGASRKAFYTSSAQDGIWLVNCAGYLTTAGAYDTALIDPNKIIGYRALTADPCVSVGARDFRLNSAAGGGADLRGAGFCSFPGSAFALSVGYPDLGALQSIAAAAGGMLPGDLTGGFNG